jgi:hypothetical protein
VPRSAFLEGAREEGGTKTCTGYSVLGVRLLFKPRRYRLHLLCVPRNAHVLSGYLERVTRRELRIGENRRGLLGQDGLSKKEKGEGT